MTESPLVTYCKNQIFYPFLSVLVGGVQYGSSDEFGYKAIENRSRVNDLDATILKLMGIDHERLTHRLNGRDFPLTDVSGNVIGNQLAQSDEPSSLKH